MTPWTIVICEIQHHIPRIPCRLGEIRREPLIHYCSVLIIEDHIWSQCIIWAGPPSELNDGLISALPALNEVAINLLAGHLLLHRQVLSKEVHVRQATGKGHIPGFDPPMKWRGFRYEPITHSEASCGYRSEILCG